MTEQLIKVEIITPAKSIFTGDAEIVTIPGEYSEFQVLHNHAPIVSALQPGIIKIELNGNITKFAVSGGLAEVRNNLVSILAPIAENQETIETDKVHNQLKEAKAKMLTQISEIERNALNQNINFYEAQLKLMNK